MKLLLLGATGRTGRIVLKTALERRYKVNCLARNIHRIETQKGLTIIEGNPKNKSDLAQAASGCDAVISTLNISRTSDFPWARLRTPKKYMSDVVAELVVIAEEIKLKHIIICSAWGVAETEKDLPNWFRWFIRNSNIGIAYQDHERQEKIISNSNLDWTIVRPVGLINSTKKENIIESHNNAPKPGLTISRQSVATYLIDCLGNDSFYRKKIIISKK